MVRKLGHKRGNFITVFLQHENICKMVRKVINNLLFRQGGFGQLADPCKKQADTKVNMLVNT